MNRLRSLHIAISARALSLPYGGVKEYVAAVLRELTMMETPHRFSIYYDDERHLGRYPGAQEVYLTARHKFMWDHWELPRRLKRDQPDVVWFPHNVSSLGLSIPTVVSVMDLLYFRVPEFPKREYALLDTLYMRGFIPRSLQQARQIMVISDWTAYDMGRLLGVPRHKIKTIHLAPGSEFTVLPSSEVAGVKAKYNLENPFFFYAGSLSFRKNIRVLIEAFGQAQHNIPQDLVITAGKGFSEVPIDDLVIKYGLTQRIQRLGNVPKCDLVALYNAADAFVFPSLYEGFGIPPLEAFACGCPVICSNATSLPEVVGDAALTFEPHDVKALANHLKAIAHDMELRTRLINAGFERVRHFSYTQSARSLLEVLETAV